MRNIDKSQWLERPDISGMKADKKGSIPTTNFSMTASQKGFKKNSGGKK